MWQASLSTVWGRARRGREEETSLPKPHGHTLSKGSICRGNSCLMKSLRSRVRSWASVKGTGGALSAKCASSESRFMGDSPTEWLRSVEKMADGVRRRVGLGIGALHSPLRHEQCLSSIVRPYGEPAGVLQRGEAWECARDRVSGKTCKQVDHRDDPLHAAPHHRPTCRRSHWCDCFLA